ncbi:MAG TPA: response regulator transcription factor [Terriglobia bacterium]|nr:response regulator transcription factor [Terriglobia bacterium]
MSAGRILIVDDEPLLRQVIRTTLKAQGYDVAEAGNGSTALDKLRSTRFDLVLLDLNMPGVTGLEACRAIRAISDVAILVLTVRNSHQDKVEVLDTGADDYVTKPFNMQELLARVRAALRRTAPGPKIELQRIQIENREIDLRARVVRTSRKQMRLTPKELDLLRYFIAHPNLPLKHRELLLAVWGPDYGDRVEYLRVFVNQLRKKIEPRPSVPRYLLTDAWEGYRFVPPSTRRSRRS